MFEQPSNFLGGSWSRVVDGEPAQRGQRVLGRTAGLRLTDDENVAGGAVDRETFEVKGQITDIAVVQTYGLMGPDMYVVAGPQTTEDFASTRKLLDQFEQEVLGHLKTVVR